MWRSGRCQPRGRMISTAGLAPTLYSLPVFGSVKSIAPAQRSFRLSWPSIMFDQTGEDASSKSAMNTLAPELSALTIILRSTGPVISTRRSVRSAGIGATFQSPARIEAVLGEEIRQAAGVEQLLPLGAEFEQRAARRIEAAMQFGDEGQRLRGQDLVIAIGGRAGDDEAGGVDGHGHS